MPFTKSRTFLNDFTQSRTFFDVFTHHARKSFHAFTQEKMCFHEFTQEKKAFHAITQPYGGPLGFLCERIIWIFEFGFDFLKQSLVCLLLLAGIFSTLYHVTTVGRSTMLRYNVPGYGPVH